MATVFQMPGRPFWFYQITGADGTRQPRISTKTTNKTKAKKMAADAEAKERERALKGNTKGKFFARIVENAARLAEDGKLSADKAEEMIRELRQLANPEFKETRLAEYWRDWIAHRARHLSPSTIANSRDAFKKWAAVAPAMMQLPVTAVEIKHVRDGVAAMQTGDSAIATSTASNYVAELRELLDNAIEERLMNHNPARSKSIRRTRKFTATKNKEKVGPFTPDEVRNLLEFASDEWKGMILFGYFSGLRMMDIARLNEINLDGEDLVQTSGKTETQTRTPLHMQLRGWLQGRKGDFFPNIRVMANSNVSTAFSNLMKKAGVPREATLPGGDRVKRSFHSLRHTFTSVLANAGIPAEVRMKLTGQKDSDVHSSYTHHDHATLKNAVIQIPSV
ncbi:tyrosine-type recombinase/integrase [Luteolibacter yonseiensis]|uniref:Tyrosine-type recombinase/integrase n=1 Tax=Luteolibacter yonseiensis TaxID=1144680 RepID=A0A934R965_9BACT|nr:tyrosine-type recombinase/integrase [Luteolibacter yonseiensis]MBK1818218.1 tyrosine-type recombinase/integrase [Luteolibacter yonseiensis]